MATTGNYTQNIDHRLSYPIFWWGINCSSSVSGSLNPGKLWILKNGRMRVLYKNRHKFCNFPGNCELFTLRLWSSPENDKPSPLKLPSPEWPHLLTVPLLGGITCKSCRLREPWRSLLCLSISAQLSHSCNSFLWERSGSLLLLRLSVILSGASCHTQQ